MSWPMATPSMKRLSVSWIDVWSVPNASAIAGMAGRVPSIPIAVPDVVVARSAAKPTWAGILMTAARRATAG